MAEADSERDARVQQEPGPVRLLAGVPAGRDERTTAIAFVSFYRGKTKVFETHPMEVTSGMSNSLKTMPLRFSIGLDPLPPGEYNCQVTVLNPDGQKSAFWQTPITLVP